MQFLLVSKRTVGGSRREAIPLPRLVDGVHCRNSSADAANLGRDRGRPLRSDGEEVKEPPRK